MSGFEVSWYLFYKLVDGRWWWVKRGSFLSVLAHISNTAFDNDYKIARHTDGKRLTDRLWTQSEFICEFKDWNMLTVRSSKPAGCLRKFICHEHSDLESWLGLAESADTTSKKIESFSANLVAKHYPDLKAAADKTARELKTNSDRSAQNESGKRWVFEYFESISPRDIKTWLQRLSIDEEEITEE